MSCVTSLSPVLMSPMDRRLVLQRSQMQAMQNQDTEPQLKRRRFGSFTSTNSPRPMQPSRIIVAQQPKRKEAFLPHNTGPRQTERELSQTVQPSGSQQQETHPSSSQLSVSTSPFCEASESEVG